MSYTTFLPNRRRPGISAERFLTVCTPNPKYWASCGMVNIREVSGLTAISVTMRLAKAWKVPGQDKKHRVFLWQHESVGICSRETAPSFVEELVDLLMKELASELQK